MSAENDKTKRYHQSNQQLRGTPLLILMLGALSALLKPGEEAEDPAGWCLDLGVSSAVGPPQFAANPEHSVTWKVTPLHCCCCANFIANLCVCVCRSVMSDSL